MNQASENPHFHGHKSLAEMVSTHLAVYRALLAEHLVAAQQIADNHANISHLQHELQALNDIEAACNVELNQSAAAPTP